MDLIVLEGNNSMKLFSSFAKVRRGSHYAVLMLAVEVNDITKRRPFDVEGMEPFYLQVQLGRR